VPPTLGCKSPQPSVAVGRETVAKNGIVTSPSSSLLHLKVSANFHCALEQVALALLGVTSLALTASLTSSWVRKDKVGGLAFTCVATLTQRAPEQRMWFGGHSTTGCEGEQKVNVLHLPLQPSFLDAMSSSAV
jgi:hypothetical protein